MVTKEQAFEALNRVQNGTSDGWQSFDVVRRFIEQSHPAPDGYVLVPVEPTEDMSDAGYEAYGKGHFTPAILDCYRAMIAAAYKPAFQYYYKINKCDDCVCWHDEGTGPYKDQRHDDLTPLVIWRTKPGADDD